MNDYIALSSLAMDLKRVAIMYHRGSEVAGRRFLEEAILRKSEINPKNIKPYVSSFLGRLDSLKEDKIAANIAEDALLYSIIFQNASLELKKNFS